MTESAERLEREAFEAAHRHLDLTMAPDAWNRPAYVHSHVGAMWSGWMARARRAPAEEAVQDQPGSGMAETAANRQETVAHAQRDPGREMAGWAAPEGWKLVPVVPTKEMLDEILSEGEARAVIGMTPEHRAILMERAGIKDRYVAMLAAAPASPKQEKV